MATRLRRNPLRRVDGELEKWCSGCEQWLVVRHHFSRHQSGARAGEILGRCKTCRCKPKTRHGEVSGYVPVLSCWWIYDEIVLRVGQQRGAEGIGISANNLRKILYKRTRHVQKRNVYRAITYLRCLRDDDVREAPTVGRRLAYHDRCSQCGTELDNYTDGCSTCWERQYSRQRRQREERGMTITRAQAVALYGLMMNMPLDTVAAVQSIDDYGHAIMEFKSESNSSTKRLKLFAGGGTAELD